MIDDTINGTLQAVLMPGKWPFPGGTGFEAFSIDHIGSNVGFGTSASTFSFE
jgi:hypothetical protein